MKVAIVVLAAGAGSRMGNGTPKQLLEIGGRTLLRHVVENALAAECGPVFVVVGASAVQVRAAIAGCEVSIAENARWPEGMGTSIQAGIRAVQETDADAAILTLADQPLITPEIFSRLVDLHETTGKPIVTAEYAGTVGVPVLFAREYFTHLLALDPGQGCKGVILKNRGESASLTCPEAEADIDTPEDYQRLLARIR